MLQTIPTAASIEQTDYGFGIVTPLAFEEAVAAITAAIKQQGFGVLTEIDVRATLKQKLDIEVPPYVILGACNPPLAYNALQREWDLGLLLPCNVIVYEEEGSGEPSTVVSIVDPVAMMEVANSPALASVAEEAQARLRRVAAALAA